MPYKNPEDLKKWKKKWEDKNRAARKLQKRSARLKKLDHYRAISEKNNRKRGFPERAKGSRALKRIRVPQIRRFVFVEDRVYFNLESGFTREDLLQLIKDWDALQESPKKTKPRKP